MLSVEDWAEIRRLYRAEKMPIKVIARTLGISRNTVRAAIASDGPPKYERKSAGSVVDAVEPALPVPAAASVPGRRGECGEVLDVSGVQLVGVLGGRELVSVLAHDLQQPV